MAKTFDWKRFWCPRGESFDISDRGFLSDPGGKWSSNSNLVTFDRLAEFPCAILLGEPGIGKSWTLEHESAEVQKSLTTGAELKGDSQMTARSELESDCIWFCPNLYRDSWTEYFKLTKRGRYDPGDKNLARYGHQFEVKLSLWEDRMYAAIYKFLKEDDARRFYTGEGLRRGEQCWLRERAYCDHFQRFMCFDFHALCIGGNQVCHEFGSGLDVEERHRQGFSQEVGRASNHRISRPNVGKRRLP